MRYLASVDPFRQGSTGSYFHTPLPPLSTFLLQLPPSPPVHRSNPPSSSLPQKGLERASLLGSIRVHDKTPRYPRHRFDIALVEASFSTHAGARYMQRASVQLQSTGGERRSGDVVEQRQSSSVVMAVMHYIQESSSSLPASLDSRHGRPRDLSWLETPRTASVASSSTSEDSSGSGGRKAKEASLWRSFFSGRSKSVPDHSAPSTYDHPSLPNASEQQPELHGIPNGERAPSRSSTGPRTSLFKPRWTTISRPGRDRRSLNVSEQGQSAELASRSSSRSGMGPQASVHRGGRPQPSRECPTLQGWRLLRPRTTSLTVPYQVCPGDPRFRRLTTFST